MVRERWEEFVAGTAPATRGGAWSNHGMTHEARACMARYRQVHGATYDNLALLFLVSNMTAKKACDDITMFCLMMDPWHSAPTMLNRVLTGEQGKQLTLNTAPCTLYPEPCTMYLLPTPCTLQAAPCTLHSIPYNLHPASCTVHVNATAMLFSCRSGTRF